MALKVVCLTDQRFSRYRHISAAMSEGIQRCGDKAVIADLRDPPPDGDAAVMWGWKHRSVFSPYRQFVYADLGYWGRDQYYRLSVNSWSPERYVCAGLPGNRFEALGLEIKPWQTGRNEILIAGCSPKSALDHGFPYMGWEDHVARKLSTCGVQVLYRPKPTDKRKTPLAGVGYDERPISDALCSARALVTHHSNAAIDALLAGIPVHCEIGAAAAMSLPLEELLEAPEPAGRVQFLHDIAWLQWTLDEMKSGACWAHLKERGLIC
jgi:hypothetical protein